MENLKENPELTLTQKLVYNTESISRQRKLAKKLIEKYNWVGENEKILHLIALHGFAHIGENYYGVEMCANTFKKSGVAFFLF